MYALMRVAYEMDQRKIARTEIDKYINAYFRYDHSANYSTEGHSMIDPSDFEEEHVEDIKTESGMTNMNLDAINSQVLELDESADELLEGIIKRHKMRSGLNTSSGLPPVVLPKVNNVRDVFTYFAQN